MGKRQARGYVVRAGRAAAGADDGVKATRRSTGGALTVIESRTTGGAPLHVHRREDECMYVLEGEISVVCGDETLPAGRGAFVFLPKGVRHSWDVVGSEATVLIIAAPGGLDEFLSEFHAAEGPERTAVAARYGIEMPGG